VEEMSLESGCTAIIVSRALIATLSSSMMLQLATCILYKDVGSRTEQDRGRDEPRHKLR
jgi:hypothetical protein